MAGCKAPGYRHVTKGSEAALKVAVGNVGPTAVGIDASHRSFRVRVILLNMLYTCLIVVIYSFIVVVCIMTHLALQHVWITLY